MAAHRFWRIRFNSVLQNFLNVAELFFMDRNLTRVLGGFPIGSPNFMGFPLANAFDGNNATLWSSDATAPLHFIGYDFGVPRDIAFVRCVRELNNNNVQYGYQVDFSDNGADWFYTGYEMLPVVGGSNSPVITPTQDFENINGVVSDKWTILFLSPTIPNNGELITTAEIAFTVGGLDVTVGGVGTGSVPLVPQLSFANAFDKNAATLFAVNNTNNYPFFLSYYFNDPVSIDGLEVTARNDGFTLGNLKHALIAAFDPLDEIDVPVYAIFNEPAWLVGEKRVYNFAPVQNNVAQSVERFNASPWISLFITEKD